MEEIFSQGGRQRGDFPDFGLGGGHEVNTDLSRGGYKVLVARGGSPPHLLTYACTSTIVVYYVMFYLYFTFSDYFIGKIQYCTYHKKETNKLLSH